MPLLHELDIIIDERINKGCMDIIIIDDIMLYDDTQEYEASHQKLTMDILPKNDRNCLDKILLKFKETHDATILTKEQGWLIFTPQII